MTTFPIFALTGPLAPATTVTLFGQRYAESALVLSILAVGYYLNVMFGFNVYTLQVCGRIRLLVGVNLFMASLNIGLCFALADELGAVGIATGQLCRAHQPEPHQPVGAARRDPHRLRAS